MKYLIFILSLFLWVGTAQADTLTVYPDAGTGNTTVDGNMDRGGVDETFSTIKNGDGNNSFDTDDRLFFMLEASTTNNQFATMRRSIMCFDTSSMGTGATIDSAIISMYGFINTNALGGTPDLDIVASTPASNNEIVNADYSNLGTTVFSSIAQSSLSTGAYNDFTLDTNGEANIDVSGISKFGGRTSWDTDNSFGGSWSSGAVLNMIMRSADQAGTSNDPKLTITYTPEASADNALFFGSGF